MYIVGLLQPDMIKNEHVFCPKRTNVHIFFMFKMDKVK